MVDTNQKEPAKKFKDLQLATIEIKEFAFFGNLYDLELTLTYSTEICSGDPTEFHRESGHHYSKDITLYEVQAVLGVAIFLETEKRFCQVSGEFAIFLINNISKEAIQEAFDKKVSNGEV